MVNTFPITSRSSLELIKETLIKWLSKIQSLIKCQYFTKCFKKTAYYDSYSTVKRGIYPQKGIVIL